MFVRAINAVPTRLTIGVVLALAAASTAQAQSTGTLSSEKVEEVIITGQSRVDLAGVLDQNAAKSRVSVSGDDLKKAASGQSFLESLNQVPGLNFTNNDPYGSSGGNLRLRGFDGSRVSLTFDGIPLNDTGNYAVFTNQMIDPELIQQVDVNLGTTDVDSPTASAIGGTINNRTRTPSEERGGSLSMSGGDFGFKRFFGMVETGSIGPWNTRAWLEASYSGNDKFKGPGQLFKRQFNAKVYQELDNGNFISAAIHYNMNRNNFYRNTSQAAWEQFGRQYDNLATCTRAAVRAGVRDDDGATLIAGTTALPSTDNPLNPSACTNYYNLRINPSNTGNLRFSSLWHLSDNVKLAVDPSYQYVLANGGGTTVINESPGTSFDKRVTGNTALAGYDLNGDGDMLDSVRFYTPNTTNTNRIGLNASLIWDITPHQMLRVAYAYDRGKHRQTGEYGYIDSDGNPLDVFGGNTGQPVPTADGSILRGRDRFSIAELNQVSAEYRIDLTDALTATVGVRMPRFTRELNQYCYTQNASTTVLCTTQAPAKTLANGNVQFGTATTEYLPPFSATVKFNKTLPNVGVTYALNDAQTLYASLAGGLSSPRTDNLYASRRLADGTLARANPDPETTTSYDIGWRYHSRDIMGSVAVWGTKYKNRIVSSFDDQLGFTVDRNVGDVDLGGIDAQVGFRMTSWATLSLMASHNDSELKQDLKISATTTLPTSGKVFVETPKQTYGVRLELEPVKNLSVSLEGKMVGERFTTDLNDASVPSYRVWHLNMSYDFEVTDKSRMTARINVYNLFDEQYYGSISSTTGALALPGFTPSAPFLSLASPRTTSFSLSMDF